MQSDPSAMTEIGYPGHGPSSTALPQRTTAGRWSRAPRRIREPATVASLALMTASGVTAVLTFGFWWLLAQRDGAATVGAVSAEVSAATFLASVGSLNMLNVLARFLPEAGGSARRLIRHGYLALAATCAAVAGLFLLTPWADRLVLGGGAGRAGFVVLVIATGVFLAQDGALVGLGHTLLVPLENVLTALTRLALIILIPFAAVRGSLLAWGTATIASVLVVNAYTLPVAGREAAMRRAPCRGRATLTRFIALDGVANAISAAVRCSFRRWSPSPWELKQPASSTSPWLVVSVVVTFLGAVQLVMVREVVARPAERARVGAPISHALGGVVLVGSAAASPSDRVLLHLLGPGFAEHAACCSCGSASRCRRRRSWSRLVHVPHRPAARCLGSWSTP